MADLALVDPAAERDAREVGRGARRNGRAERRGRLCTALHRHAGTTHLSFRRPKLNRAAADWQPLIEHTTSMRMS
ncbi:MAG TPA: hypothetical protein VF695_06175 [Sphingomonas sp.]|jgi:hypothetical protein